MLVSMSDSKLNSSVPEWPFSLSTRNTQLSFETIYFPYTHLICKSIPGQFSTFKNPIMSGFYSSDTSYYSEEVYLLSKSQFHLKSSGCWCCISSRPVPPSVNKGSLLLGYTLQHLSMRTAHIFIDQEQSGSEEFPCRITWDRRPCEPVENSHSDLLATSKYLHQC